MSITIELNPEAEGRLRQVAARQEQEAAVVAREILEERLAALALETPVDNSRFAEALARLRKASEDAEPGEPVPHSDPQEALLSDLIAEKFRRQGLNV